MGLVDGNPVSKSYSSAGSYRILFSHYFFFQIYVKKNNNTFNHKSYTV